jgi:Spy/CpxP family protein refolding chaperone
MSPSEPSPKTIRRMTAMLLLATFAAGTVTGGALVRWFVSRPSPSSDFPHLSGPVPWDNLDLSASQRGKVDEILERYRPKLDAILNETFPKVQIVIAQVDSEIREILTPEQRGKFDQAKVQRHNLPPRPPGGFPGNWPGVIPSGPFGGPPVPPPSSSTLGSTLVSPPSPSH